MVTSLITLITKIPLLKYCFGYSATIWMAYKISPQNSPINGFIENILVSIPSRIVGYLGIVYGVAIVLKKVSEAWKSHQINRYEVKMAREDFQQKEIETDKQRKEL